jgi:uncharacterized protein
VTYDLRTRREALRLLGAGAAAAAGVPAASAALTDIARGRTRARYFALADVRLREGPFLTAQRLDADYLLEIEPDRLLHNFRVNARLDPQAPVYGGWESVDPWIEIRCHGHTLGHYLSACACMFRSTDEAHFAQRVDYIVAELAQVQAKTGGWLAAFPDGAAPLLDSLAGKPFPGVPWYTTHKVMAGLRDAHVIRGNKPALAVLIQFADWIDAASRPLTDQAFQKMLDREHGGMNEVLADLYALTFDARYEKLALRFSHRALLDPLSARRDTLDGLHANTQIPKVIGFSRIFDLSGFPDYGNAAEFFWNNVVEQRSFATGGHGDAEHFFPPHEFASHLSSGKTMETCCTHNMLRLTRGLYARDPKAAYFDFFERALFNSILASQDPDSGMNTYFQSTRPGYVRLFHTPFDSFWCCTGSGLENHARYGESIYAHDADSLYINLFLASTLEWRERGLTITQTTRFPDSPHTELKFTCDRRQNLAIKIRHPDWCPVMSTMLNGKGVGISRTPGRYFRVPSDRLLPGDSISIELPMALSLAPLPNAPEYAAVMYGPIALAANLGNKGLTPGSQLIVNERHSGEMLNDPAAIPVWSKTLDQLPASLVRTDEESLRFVSTGFEGGNRVEFVPWFRLAHARYNLYWRRGVAS